jgi:hypothetical protein
VPKHGLVAAMTLVASILVGGCGDDGGSTGTGSGTTSAEADASGSSSASASSPSASDASSRAESSPTALPDWPECDDVWLSRQTLPHSYRGCLDHDRAVRSEDHPCASGEPLVTYASRFWAKRGDTIHEGLGSQDPGYKAALAACAG